MMETGFHLPTGTTAYPRTRRWFAAAAASFCLCDDATSVTTRPTKWLELGR